MYFFIFLNHHLKSDALIDLFTELNSQSEVNVRIFTYILLFLNYFGLMLDAGGGTWST